MIYYILISIIIIIQIIIFLSIIINPEKETKWYEDVHIMD